ncbi:hypothetical protein M8C21_019160, partial [Ambrosia artemisiifolia]
EYCFPQYKQLCFYTYNHMKHSQTIYICIFSLLLSRSFLPPSTTKHSNIPLLLRSSLLTFSDQDVEVGFKWVEVCTGGRFIRQPSEAGVVPIRQPLITKSTRTGGLGISGLDLAAAVTPQAAMESFYGILARVAALMVALLGFLHEHEDIFDCFCPPSRTPPLFVCFDLKLSIHSGFYLILFFFMLMDSWGGSSRPDFTCKSTEETEAWFIDTLEEWRKAKNLDNFILVGHSFGGYIAAKHAFKLKWLTKFRTTWKGAVMNHLWESNFTPMKVLRGLGPWGPNLVRKYTSARFGEGDMLSEEESKLLTDYMYYTLAAKASGELCLKYTFSFGAFARSPLLQRASEWKVPTTFIYGFQDWMNYQGALDARKNISVPCEIIRVPKTMRTDFTLLYYTLAA